MSVLVGRRPPEAQNLHRKVCCLKQGRGTVCRHVRNPYIKYGAREAFRMRRTRPSFLLGPGFAHQRTRRLPARPQPAGAFATWLSGLLGEREERCFVVGLSREFGLSQASPDALTRPRDAGKALAQLAFILSAHAHSGRTVRRGSMFCAISGAPPEEPVVSRASGILFERRLIQKSIAVRVNSADSTPAAQNRFNPLSYSLRTQMAHCRGSQETGECPVTKQPLSLDDLLAVKTNKVRMETLRQPSARP